MQAQDNKILGRATFVSSFGDFLSLFAFLLLVYESSDSVAIAAYVVPVKSIGIVFAGLTFPNLCNHFSLRKILILSEIISGALLFLLLILLFFQTELPVQLFFGILFSQSLLKQYFNGARESFSKNLGTNDTHRTLQAELIHGFASAQFLGPIAALFLLTYFPIEYALCIDGISFFIGAFLCFKLSDIPIQERHSIFAPLTYLHKNPILLKIFILRSVGFWIPAGISNYFLFLVVKEHYKLELLQSAWVYATLGLGMTAASTLLLDGGGLSWIKKQLKFRSDASIAAGALILIALSRIAFFSLESFILALGILLFSGIGLGLNAISTQSIRRKASNSKQFPEIVGLELILGKTTEWIVSTVVLLALASGLINLYLGMWLAVAGFVVLALLHMSDDIRNL